MSEKRFLSFVLTEGLLLVVLGMCMLSLPKITEISFGFMLCIALLIYGGYKTITAILSRNFQGYFLINVLNGILMTVTGFLMFFAEIIDITVIITLLGVFFIIESIASSAFSIHVNGFFPNWRKGYFTSYVQLLFGIALLLFLPSLWMGGVFIGLNFLLYGYTLLNMYLAKKYIH